MRRALEIAILRSNRPPLMEIERLQAIDPLRSQQTLIRKWVTRQTDRVNRANAVTSALLGKIDGEGDNRRHDDDDCKEDGENEN
jgi:hypothetical protein